LHLPSLSLQACGGKCTFHRSVVDTLTEMIYRIPTPLCKSGSELCPWKSLLSLARPTPDPSRPVTTRLSWPSAALTRPCPVRRTGAAPPRRAVPTRPPHERRAAQSAATTPGGGAHCPNTKGSKPVAGACSRGVLPSRHTLHHGGLQPSGRGWHR
jgi:hypothetical protein